LPAASRVFESDSIWSMICPSSVLITCRSASVSVAFAACMASSLARTIWFDMASTALSASESCVVIASMLRMNCWLSSMLR